VKSKSSKPTSLKQDKKKQRKASPAKPGKTAKAQLKALPAPDRSHDPALLDTSRIQWQHGNWADLALMDVRRLSSHPDRARLALVVSAAHAQMGDMAQAREFADHALDWGCSREVAAHILISSAHNALARLATCLEDDSALDHFTSALRIVEPNADVPLLARSRQIRETARLGLMSDHLDMRSIGFEDETTAPSGHAERRSTGDDTRTVANHRQSDQQRQAQALAKDLQATVAPNLTSINLQRRSSSQLGQDIWALEKLRYKRGGYFVDVGAMDGLMASNTLMLERDFGWTGLCAEPNPDFFRQLRQNRKAKVLEACIGPRSGDEVAFILDDENSSLAVQPTTADAAFRLRSLEAAGKVLHCMTQSLNDFLTTCAAPHEIDFLSLDTGGNEFEILSTFPFQNWKVRLVAVGHHSAPQSESMREILLENGYVQSDSRWDDWYELVDGLT
jgi:FkbM family methyltransferase